MGGPGRLLLLHLQTTNGLGHCSGGGKYFGFFDLFKNSNFKFCWDQGGYLAEIMSPEENLLLDTFLIEGTSYILAWSY